MNAIEWTVKQALSRLHVFQADVDRAAREDRRNAGLPRAIIAMRARGQKTAKEREQQLLRMIRRAGADGIFSSLCSRRMKLGMASVNEYAHQLRDAGLIVIERHGENLFIDVRARA